jgi:hypothetical protein
MSNFVGVVTQQDMQTGVTLRARVTSPKEHYTAYQDFRCMVKKAGLTDEQAVTTDLNTVANKLLANGVTGITSNLTGYMPAVGENETNVKYVVTGDDISNYFNSDGIVTKRPPYGANAVIGSLSITVTKNAAMAQRDITISIEPYTSEELVDSVLDTITWNSIRGTNAVETADPSTNGMYNVIYPLKLIKSITSDLVATPVSVTWTVVQDSMEDLITGNRVNISTGEITRPAYTDIYETKDVTIPSSLIDITTSKIENAYGRTYIRVGGLTLKASITIEDAVSGGQIIDSVTFNLKTLSKALTNSEVAEYLTENISLFSMKDTKYNSVFTLSTINDVSERTIFIDTTGVGSSVLEMFNTSGVFTATSANDLTEAGLNVINVAWTAVDPATVNTSPVSIPLTNYSATGLQKVGDDFVLTLNPTVVPTETKLIMRCVISVNSYDGAISYITAFYRFTLDNITPVTP